MPAVQCNSNFLSSIHIIHPSIHFSVSSFQYPVSRLSSLPRLCHGDMESPAVGAGESQALLGGVPLTLTVLFLIDTSLGLETPGIFRGRLEH